MRLGTNSPNKMVLKVMKVTTKAVARPSAKRSATPWVSNQSDTLALNAASPTMPLSTPMDVMPICTVDRNWVGFAISLSAARAPLSPASLSAAKRALRLDAKAISDMANTPFKRVSKTISRTSMGSNRVKQD